MTKEYLFSNVYFSVFILFINTSVSDAFFESVFIHPSIISISRLITNCIFIFMIFYYFLIDRIKLRKYMLGIVLVSATGITLLWTPAMFESIKMYINIIGPVCYFIIYCLIVNKEKMINNIKIYCNVLLISELISLILPSKVGYMDVSMALRGIHLSRSSLVVYLNFCIFIYLLSIVKNKEDNKKLDKLSLIMIGLSAILVVLSRSSTGIVTVLMFFILALLLKKRVIFNYIFAGSIFAGIALPLMNVNSPAIESIVKMIFGKTLTFSGRKYIWDYTLKNLSKNPILGNGFNSTTELMKDKVIPVYGHAAAHSHNGFLETFLQGGILGLVLLIAIIIIAYKSIKYLPIVERNILRAYIIVFIVFNFMEPYLNDQVSLINMWLPAIYIITSKYKNMKRCSRMKNNIIKRAV